MIQWLADVLIGAMFRIDAHLDSRQARNSLPRGR